MKHHAKCFLLLLASLFVLQPANALAAHTITGAEYYIDTDPGEGLGSPIQAKDGAFDSDTEVLNFGINTSNLTIGPHFLFIRMKNEEGVWGIPNKHLFMVTGAKFIISAEYFFDEDPGKGEGTSLFAKDGKFDEPCEKIRPIQINTSSLSVGLHKLYIRMRNSEGKWGLSRQYTFEVSPIISGSSTISEAEFYVDEEPGFGEGTSMAPVDGNFDGANESASVEYDTSDLSIGEHLGFIRMKDSNGHWTQPAQKAVFEVAAPSEVPTITSPSNNAEISDTEIILEWTAVAGASGYEILLDQTCDFLSPEIQKYEEGNDYTCATISRNLSDGDYCWKLRAKFDSDNYGPWSQVSEFTLTNPNVLYGDSDGNKSVELKDAILALKAISTGSMSGLFLGSDVNSDDKIGLQEAIYCLRFLAETNDYFRLAQHYSPIIYQHVDVDVDLFDADIIYEGNTYGVGGYADLIVNFDYDGDWSGNNNWPNLNSHIFRSTAKATVYYSVVETTQNWFLYYAIFHPRDWSNKFAIDSQAHMHENDMEAVTLMINKGQGFPGNLKAAMSMSHNVWVEYPIGEGIVSKNTDGFDEYNCNGVTYIHNSDLSEFVNNGHHPRIYVQSKGHGIFMDANSDSCLTAGGSDPDTFWYYPTASPIDNWDEEGFSGSSGYDGTGVVYYCSSENNGETVSRLETKIIDSGGEQDNPKGADEYGQRWIKYQLLPMAELWNRREWKKNNDICKDWMFAENSEAFLGEKHGYSWVTINEKENQANPPWSIPDCIRDINVQGCIYCMDIGGAGEIFKDPLNAFPNHFGGIDLSGEEYMYNPYN